MHPNESFNLLEMLIEKQQLQEQLNACQLLICSTEDLESKIDFYKNQVILIRSSF